MMNVGGVAGQLPYVNSNIAPASSSSSVEQVVLTVDGFFAVKIHALRELIQSDEKFAPFRFLSDSLLGFIYAEKMRMSLNPGIRNVVDENNKTLSGYENNYDAPNDIYHPKQFIPFEMKGFWIPEEEGKLYSCVDHLPSSLVREKNRQREVLFLIHPVSEHLFHPLMTKYRENKVDVSAFSLSSFRTLLVAIPTNQRKPEYVFVKTSLDRNICGASRVLSNREAALSVANTALLETAENPIQHLKEPFSFVPNSDLLSEGADKERGAGMIFRETPKFLSDPESKIHAIPFYAILGQDNRDLLDILIQQSGKTPTRFVVEHIIRPIANIFVSLIFFQNASMEIHGQNLIMLLDEKSPNKVDISFMYRDMGGVNLLRTSQEKEQLPECLKDEKHFYTSTHVYDTGQVLERFAGKFLFHLTKQFVKGDYAEKDLEFAQWKSTMSRGNFIHNWTIPHADRDAHMEIMRPHEFIRYGYFENHFAHELLEALSLQGIFIEASMDQQYPEEASYENLHRKIIDPNNPLNSCIGFHWFADLITLLYPSYLRVTHPERC